MQDVFGNKTYYASETRIKSIRLRPTTDTVSKEQSCYITYVFVELFVQAFMAKSDVDDEILEIKQDLKSQMELIDRLIDVEVSFKF